MENRFSGDSPAHFLNVLLPIPKRRSPAPSRNSVIGQGKGQPNSGLGMPATISIESTINQNPANSKSHFDAVSIVSLPPSQLNQTICQTHNHRYWIIANAQKQYLFWGRDV
jgi:hypothetical protein